MKSREISLPYRDIDQPGGWHGSSPEWLGTVRELSSSNEDKTDYLFTVPIEILKGCSCKTVEDLGATNLPRGMDALLSLVLANNWHRSSYPRILIHIWQFHDSTIKKDTFRTRFHFNLYNTDQNGGEIKPSDNLGKRRGVMVVARQEIPATSEPPVKLWLAGRTLTRRPRLPAW